MFDITSIPIAWIVVAIVSVGIAVWGWMVWTRSQESNDPYPFGKRHEKVYVIFTERDALGLNIVNILPAKWGDKGLYVKELNKVFTALPYISGKYKVFHLTKGEDGAYYPASLTVVDTQQVDVLAKKPLEELSPEQRGQLVFLLPATHEYKAAMSSYVNAVYQKAKEQVLKNMDLVPQSFLQKLGQALTPEVLILIFGVSIVGLLLLGMMMICGG